MGKLIELVGNTGIGKTSLARALAKTGEFNLGLEEHQARPFQTLFKSDPRYALANQIDYFLVRAEQERVLRQSPETGLLDGGLDQDFQGFTRLFLARALLGDAEYGLCCRFYEFIRSQLPTPDLIIYLTAPQETIRQRLAGRDRINIARAEDLNLLDSYLDAWVSSLPSEQVLRVDISSTSASYQELLPILIGKIKGRLGMDSGIYETGYIP